MCFLCGACAWLTHAAGAIQKQRKAAAHTTFFCSNLIPVSGGGCCCRRRGRGWHEAAQAAAAAAARLWAAVTPHRPRFVCASRRRPPARPCRVGLGRLRGGARLQNYRRRPRRPPFRRVESVGMGVTSSMRPILMPERASARSADWAPGPGVLVRLPPVARSLMCSALTPSSCRQAGGGGRTGRQGRVSAWL